jgi:hypothetical protein
MAKGRKAPPTAEEMRAVAARVEAHAEAAEAWEIAMRETYGPHVEGSAEWRSHPSGMFRCPVLSADEWKRAADADQASYRGPVALPPGPALRPEPFNPEEERLQPMSKFSL